MSRITVGGSDPSGTQSVSSSVSTENRTYTLTYTNVSAMFGFRGPNQFPPVTVSLFINRTRIFPAPRGEVRLTLFDGTVITISFYSGGVGPLISPSNVTAYGRPLRIRSVPTGGGPPLVIIEKDITVNDRNQIVTYDPTNITNTLVYSFQIEYAVGIFLDTLSITPILAADVSNINDATGGIVYKTPIAA